MGDKAARPGTRSGITTSSATRTSNCRMGPSRTTIWRARSPATRRRPGGNAPSRLTPTTRSIRPGPHDKSRCACSRRCRPRGERSHHSQQHRTLIRTSSETRSPGRAAVSLSSALGRRHRAYFWAVVLHANCAEQVQGAHPGSQSPRLVSVAMAGAGSAALVGGGAYVLSHLRFQHLLEHPLYDLLEEGRVVE